MSKPRIAQAVVASLATMSLAACGGSSSPAASGSGDKAGAKKTITIGVSVADQKSLFYIAAVDGMKKAAADAGVKLNILSADNDANKQVNQVNDLLTQKVDALIFIAQDATSAAAGVKAANADKVPVIAVDEKPESGAGKLATYIATDSVKAAHDLCTFLFKQIGGSGDIGILQGVLGATAMVQRTAGCDKALKETPSIKVVAKQSANWDESQGFKATQNMLQANPGIKAIFAESDAMALGAAKAAKAANRKIISVGIDGFPTMIQGIKDKLTQATQAQIPYKMGQLAIANAISIANGQGASVPPLQYQDTVLVSDANVNTVNPVDFYGPNVK